MRNPRCHYYRCYFSVVMSHVEVHVLKVVTVVLMLVIGVAIANWVE